MICCLVLGLGITLTGWQLCGHSLSPESADPVGPSPFGPLFWRGVSSCSAASCHGGDHPGGKGSEQTTWAKCDPHARAYLVLFEERSRVIVKNYYQLAEDRMAEPEKVTLCLSCHVAPDVSRKPGVPPLFHTDGVSCESCHGPAGRWLTQHYQPAWKQQGPAEKSALGFRLTRDLLVRARLCADCHVGKAGMEVNHDLLAAGHPRLNFELASFQAIYPKHWSDRDDRARYPDFEARSWALGQVVSAQAALDLLAYRADTRDRPWPEFAENNCYACHHELRARPSREQAPGQPLGVLTMNDWYYAELPAALRYMGKPTDVSAELEDLRKEMGRRVPDRARVGRLANRASAQLGSWLQQPVLAPPPGPDQLRSLLLSQVSSLGKSADEDWDRAAQNYLAAAALHHALKDVDPRFHDPALLAILCQRRKELEFPPDSRSPGKRETGSRLPPPD
jgi:hypothetical protein